MKPRHLLVFRLLVMATPPHMPCNCWSQLPCQSNDSQPAIWNFLLLFLEREGILWGCGLNFSPPRKNCLSMKATTEKHIEWLYSKNHTLIPHIYVPCKAIQWGDWQKDICMCIWLLHGWGLVFFSCCCSIDIYATCPCCMFAICICK